ncbi:hypothetical protein [Mariprofundus ferrooxydans]|uniref:Uncharacterized protein n=1 Tax=Mariprofundus ferrooxydans PV-1 TaxID=314345 RepID=Q0F1T0_9PROT|nr:hypothetical protein [Mariprofundus ferrooxydans]EAU55820.1 hypothetical protein SPV1_02692 [Mariprofundus ferrooxydans PV-1]
MITIRTSTSRAVLIGGQPANGWLTFTPSASFEYDGADGERKIVLLSPIKALLANGQIVDGVGNPATLDLAPTEGAGHDITGIYYNLRITADGASTLNEQVILPATTFSPIELADLPRATTNPTAPVQLITGPQGGQGIQGNPGLDGKTMHSGTGAPGAGLGVDGDYYIDTAAWDIYGPKTAGAWGAATSIIGPQGGQGIQGNPGLDGKTMHSGTSAPGAGLGVDGDYYIDTAAWDIYGPKTAGAWGAATSIIGPQGGQGIQGNPGLDGKTMHSGTGAPAAGLGVDGDYYIDTAAWDIYGPKTAGAWGAATSIIGPQGGQGIQGNPGLDGKTMHSGTGAPGAGLGVDGDYYIDTAAWDIYGPKTAGAWGAATSIIGPQGGQGIQGNPGLDGKTMHSGTSAPGAGLGVDGDYYIDTAAWDIYGPKTAGAWGAATSIIGPQGGQGIQGNPGLDGKTMHSGTGAPAAGLGVDGDYYIDTAAWDIYGPKTAGAWGAATSIIGPQGGQGIQGNPGLDGKTMHSGTGAPGAGLGVDGDYYIDTAAWDIYGPKAAGAWPPGVSIIGPPGPTGSVKLDNVALWILG